MGWSKWQFRHWSGNALTRLHNFFKILMKDLGIQEAVRDLSNQRGGVSWSPKSVLRSALKRHHLGHVISKVHIWGYKDWTQFQLPMKNLHLSTKKQNVPKMGTASPYRGSLRGGLGEVHCGQRRWHKMMSKQLAKAYISKLLSASDMIIHKLKLADRIWSDRSKQAHT